MVNTEAYVSTGHLPPAPNVQGVVSEAYERFRTRDEGALSNAHPALAAVADSLFGICIAGTDGNVYTAGDAGCELTLMNLSEPFVFALVCEALGPDVVRDRVGVDPTCAIATTSLVPGANLDEKWELLQDGFARLAGRRLPLDQDIYASATATNHRMLTSVGRLHCDPIEAMELYMRQSALRVNALDLALMGATLADGGAQPMTHDQVLSAEVCHYTLAMMVSAGMHEGTWIYDVGMPAKSAVSGGIVTVSPGKGALATFAPRLDSIGNSIKGQLAAKYLSRQLGLGLFVSQRHA